MKKATIITTFFLLISSLTFCQEIDKKGMARTTKRQGIEIYILSEPLREYEVTGKVTSNDVTAWINAFNGEADTRTISQLIDALVDNANRKAKKGKFEYDAIITEDAYTGTCIKFKPGN